MEAYKQQLSLSSFQFKKVLNENTVSKTVYLLGSYSITDENPQQAILICEKMQFLESEIPILGTRILTHTELVDRNDIYYWLESGMSEADKNPRVKISLIYPATDAHIAKYKHQDNCIVRETSEIYEKIVVNYIKTRPTSRISWIHNILAGQSEAEKVLYSDSDSKNGFVILPDRYLTNIDAQ